MRYKYVLNEFPPDRHESLFYQSTRSSATTTYLVVSNIPLVCYPFVSKLVHLLVLGCWQQAETQKTTKEFKEIFLRLHQSHMRISGLFCAVVVGFSMSQSRKRDHNVDCSHAIMGRV